jgi:hypothetical protein
MRPGKLSTALEAAMAWQCHPILEWREYARRCLRVDFEPLAGAIFHSSVKPIFPELRIVRAARGYVRSLEMIGLAASVDNHTLIRKHIVDLAVLAATARCPIGESSARAVLATRRTAALEYIASHFSDQNSA